jgi:hypothetical protein
MTEVYSNSYCTLTALSSKDGTEGCNESRDLHLNYPGDFTDIDIPHEGAEILRFRLFFHDCIKPWSQEYDGEMDTYGTLPQATRENPITVAPLRFRAWALQEKELSRRSIHFSRRQLLWECRELRAMAQLPWCGLGYCSRPLFPSSADEQWLWLVEDYVTRSLTFESDRLPALSGPCSHQACWTVWATTWSRPDMS